MQIDKEVAFLEKAARVAKDVICVLDYSGKLETVNEAFTSITGYALAELLGEALIDFIEPVDQKFWQEALEEAVQKKDSPLINTLFKGKTGNSLCLQWSIVWSAEDELYFCNGRNICQGAFALTNGIQQEAFYQVLVEYGTDMAALLDAEGHYLYAGGSPKALANLGIDPQNLKGQLVFNYLHPDDLARLQQTFGQILQSSEPVSIPDFRFKTQAGEWRWIEATAINQLHNPHINGIVITSHDITERVHNRQLLQESEQRFKALFENNPSLVFFEGTDGLIQDVNPVLLKTFNIKETDIIGNPLSNFLPLDILCLCEDHLSEALNGNQVKYQLELEVGSLGPRHFEITKIPVSIASEVVGVYTIASDITESTNNYKTIQRQARKLNTIFESITDAFFTMDRNWNFTFINSEFDRVMNSNRETLIGKNLLDLDPGNKFISYFAQLKHALDTGESVHFEAFVEHKDLWLEVKAYPSEEGLSIYFIDVTEKVTNRKQLEKLSLVASKTINGVIFLDSNRVVEWVNDGFTNLTGFSAEEAYGNYPGDFLKGPDTDPEVARIISDNINKNIPFQAEVINYKKTGEKVWFALDFTPVLEKDGMLARYIIMQTDITYRKETEAAQLKLTNDLYKQNRDMQQFTYIVSHNLRAPVANALGYTAILTETDKNSEIYNQYLANLKTSIFRLDSVLKDLNLILSIRDNENDYDLEPVNLAIKCRKVITHFQELLERCGAEIMVDIPEDTIVKGNKVYIHSMFYNLLSNAIKYRSPERALKVTIKCFDSTVLGTIISFEDNGSGFNQEKAGDQVFKMYKRFHNKVEGKGIGLFLVKTHIEAMGGQIEVTSKVNEGTRFLIYFK